MIVPSLKPRGFAKAARDAFEQGIHREFAKLAKRGVETVVMHDGVMVRGVPRRVKGRFVVSATSPRSVK